jgi:hypothetical protein
MSVPVKARRLGLTLAVVRDLREQRVPVRVVWATAEPRIA